MISFLRISYVIAKGEKPTSRDIGICMALDLALEIGMIFYIIVAWIVK